MQQQVARTLTSPILVLGGLAVTAQAQSGIKTISTKQGVRYFKSLRFLSLLFGLLTLCVGIAFGQAISGNLVGTVSDPTGAMVANAKVTATKVVTNASGVDHTNSTG